MAKSSRTRGMMPGSAAAWMEKQATRGAGAGLRGAGAPRGLAKAGDSSVWTDITR